LDRAFTNILCSNVNAAAAFYQDLLGMTRHFESDWFVVLTHEGVQNLEFGLLDVENDIVPEAIKSGPRGVILTFVVKDVAPVFDKAKALHAKIIEPPTDMPYGQRRLLIEDRDGTVLDISAPNAPLQQ